MGVIVGFIVGYVLGTKAGAEGFEELKGTLKSITSSEELKDLATGGLSILGDVLKTGVGALADRSSGKDPAVRRIA